MDCPARTVSLGLFRLGFPLLILLFRLFIRLGVPEAVVILQEGPLEPGDLIVRIVLAQKPTVDALRREDGHFRAALAVKLHAQGADGLPDAGILEVIENALHRRVAG